MKKLKDTNQILRSVTARFKVPAVIRLLYKTARRFVPAVKYSRRGVHERDNYSCQYCGSRKTISIDHIMPVSRGGQSTWENTVSACNKCNGKKGSRTPEEAGMPLMSIPRKPGIFETMNWHDFFPE